MAVSHVFSTPIADATGTVTIWNGATTATVAASDIVKPGDWNSAHNQFMTLGGNTAGQSAVSGTNVVFAGGNNITLSANGSTVSFVGPTAAGTGFTSTTTGGTAIVGTLTTNGISLGVPAFVTTFDATSGRAGTGFTSTTQGGVGVAGTLTTNGLSMAFPAWLTTARNSTDAIGLNTALTAGPLAWTVNSSGLSLNASSVAGTTSGFAGNSISGSMTHNTAGLNLSLNHPAWLTTARGSTDAIGLNTAQSNVTWTVNSSGLSLDARGYAGTGTTFGGTNVSASVTLNSAGLNFSLSGVGGGVINQTGPNLAAGGVTVTDGTVVFSNDNRVSFGLAGSTMTASYGDVSVSTMVPWFGSNTATITHGGMGTTTASAYFYPVVLNEHIAFNHIKFAFSASLVTQTSSGAQTITSAFGLFSKNGNTLNSISTGSFSIAHTGSSVSGTFSYPTATSETGYGYGTQSHSGTAQGQSLFGTAGNRVADLVFGNSMTLSPGVYYLGFHQRQSTSNSNVGISTAGQMLSVFGFTGNGYFGANTANFTSSTAFRLGGHGVYTSTGSAGFSGTTLPVSALVTGINASIPAVPFVTLMST